MSNLLSDVFRQKIISCTTKDETQITSLVYFHFQPSLYLFYKVSETYKYNFKQCNYYDSHCLVHWNWSYFNLFKSYSRLKKNTFRD